MKNFEINVQTTANSTVIVRAPDEKTAIEYLKENLDPYNIDWTVDEMNAEVDAGFRDVQKGGVTVVDMPYGICEMITEADAQYEVSENWLRDAGYEIIVTVRKRETA